MFAALTACSATPAAPAIPGLPASVGEPEQGAEASAAIAAAKLCVQTTGGMNDGFVVAVEEATAHRDPSDAARWIVAFPPGHYLGRLPPPGPGSTLLIAVEPAKSSRCTAVPSTPPVR